MQINYTIEIASILETESDRVIKEVVIHELIHTCPGCFNHGKEWKRRVGIVNQEYGYQISTYVKVEQLDMDIPEEKVPKYEVRCRVCNHVAYRKKRSKVIVNPEKYRCGKCGGTLTVRKI